MLCNSCDWYESGNVGKGHVETEIVHIMAKMLTEVKRAERRSNFMKNNISYMELHMHI